MLLNALMTPTMLMALPFAVASSLGAYRMRHDRVSMWCLLFITLGALMVGLGLGKGAL